MKRRTENPLLSIVVPVFNEEDAIAWFVDAVAPILARQNMRYEMLFVDDGSRDNTLLVLRAVKKQNDSVRIISLSRNFGKDAALTAGLDFAVGDVVIPMDVDLQDPPEVIAHFVERWRAGADVVHGVRTSRAEDGILKRTSANIFYRVFNVISPVQIPSNAGDFRLIDRRVVEEIKRMKERGRFMKGLMAWPGFKSDTVEFERKQRVAGHTSWNYWKLWNFALDGITSYSTLPLRLWLYIGASVSLFAFVYALFIIIHVFVAGGDVAGYPSLIVAIMFFGGVQIMSIGLIGEYVGRIYHEIKDRPIYVVDTIE